MTCHEAAPLLSGLHDGTLTPDARADVQRHVDACTTCRGLLSDIARISSAAQSLGPIEPPAHLWMQVAGRIRLDDSHHVVPQAVLRPTISRTDRMQWIGLAAALLLVTAGVYVSSRPSPSVPAAQIVTDGNAPPPPTVETVEDTLRRAQAEYERAIVMLEAVVREGTQDVSPEALATLQRNVTTIDSAIAESRAALTDNPASQPARTSLFEALRNKVNLLQSTIVLMNEMRQGDAGGAAEAAAGIVNKTS